MMEPNTATKLKTRKRNVLKDFVAMAGPFGVTHLLAFNKTKAGTNLVRLSLGRPLYPLSSLVHHWRRLAFARGRLTARAWRWLRSPFPVPRSPFPVPRSPFPRSNDDGQRIARLPRGPTLTFRVKNVSRRTDRPPHPSAPCLRARAATPLP